MREERRTKECNRGGEWSPKERNRGGERRPKEHNMGGGRKDKGRSMEGEQKPRGHKKEGGGRGRGDITPNRGGPHNRQETVSLLMFERDTINREEEEPGDNISTGRDTVTHTIGE